MAKFVFGGKDIGDLVEIIKEEKYKVTAHSVKVKKGGKLRMFLKKVKDLLKPKTAFRLIVLVGFFGVLVPQIIFVVWTLSQKVLLDAWWIQFLTLLVLTTNISIWIITGILAYHAQKLEMTMGYATDFFDQFKRDMESINISMDFFRPMIERAKKWVNMLTDEQKRDIQRFAVYYIDKGFEKLFDYIKTVEEEKLKAKPPKPN